MSQSGRPTAAAVVTAPILRLWVLNRDGSSPAFASKELKWFWKVHLVNNGCVLWLAPQYCRNFCIAATGHTDELAAPICNIVPFYARSVLEALMCTCIALYSGEKSVSVRQRWMAGS